MVWKAIMRVEVEAGTDEKTMNIWPYLTALCSSFSTEGLEVMIRSCESLPARYSL